jgi:DNA-binding CsgD family transcriptional regulator
MVAVEHRMLGASSEVPPQVTQFLSPSSLAEYQHSPSGFVLTDFSLRPLYANDTAFRILNYSSARTDATEWETFAQARIRLIFHTTHYTVGATLLSTFVSGRRQYICRSFLLDVRDDRTRPPVVAILIERFMQLPIAWVESIRRYHLSPRERETVLHLTRGLSTKEIAQRMNVSPNTIKQFVRLIMSKMRVTTRSGILGRLLVG